MKKPVLHNAEDPSTQQLEVLREILAGAPESRFQQIENSLSRHTHSADDIASVLAEAIVKRRDKDKLLDSAMAPVIQRGMEYSIQRNKEAISNVIFPVLGPSIRKYVLSLFQELVQSLQSILETTVSIKSLQWRFESWRTSIPYAEVVLANSLLYRVEDVLLIHKETGLLISHVSHLGSSATDPDLTSSILKAIQDFVQDSFEDAEHSGVHVIEVASFKILIEQKGSVFIAARVRGFPPQELSVRLEETLEDILLQHNNELQEFNGDMEALEPVSDLLKDCLVQKSVETQKKKPIVAIGIVAVLLLFILTWFGFEQYKRHLLQNSLSILNQEPGIFVSHLSFASEKVHVLRDAYAKKIEDVIDVNRWPYNSLLYKETPFASSEPEIVIRRLQRQIEIPSTLHVQWREGTYYFTGMTSETWWEENKSTIKHFPELFPRDFSVMSLVNVNILDKMKAQIKNMSVLFISGQSQIPTSQTETLRVLEKKIKRAVLTARALDLSLVIQIQGHTSQVGETISNKRLSLQRALSVKNWLSGQGIAETHMRVVGMGEEQPIYMDNVESKQTWNQRVQINFITKNKKESIQVNNKGVFL
jgi:OOP family OmpA-OmpF porin